MPNPVLITDLEQRFRSLTDAEKVNAEALLTDAWEVALARVPGLEERLASGELRTGLAVSVVAAMAVRVLRNPDALKAWIVDGDSFTRDSLVSSGLLFISDDEIGLLTGVPRVTVQVPFSGSLSYR